MFTHRDKIKYKPCSIILDLEYPWGNNREWWKVLLTIINITLQFIYLDGYILYLARWWKTEIKVSQRVSSFPSETHHYTKSQVLGRLKIHRFSRGSKLRHLFVSSIFKELFLNLYSATKIKSIVCHSEMPYIWSSISLVS